MLSKKCLKTAQEMFRLLERKWRKEKKARRPLINELLFAIILKDHSVADASAAYQRLVGGFVDLNELRVSAFKEVEELLVPSVKLNLHEKSLLIKNFLNQVFFDRNKMSLEYYNGRDMDELRRYLAKIDGMEEEMVRYAIFHGDYFPRLDPTAEGQRVVKRMGFLDKGLAPAKFLASFEEILTEDDHHRFFLMLEDLANTGCELKGPRCGECPAKPLCETGKKFRGKPAKAAKPAGTEKAPAEGKKAKQLAAKA